MSIPTQVRRTASGQLPAATSATPATPATEHATVEDPAQIRREMAAMLVATEPAVVPQPPVVPQPAVVPETTLISATDDESNEETADAAEIPMRRRNRVARVAWYGTVAVLAAFLVVCAIWTVTGGRTYVVSTPSMSPGIPVGSLVLTRPVPAGGPHVGQIIAFHPPNQPKTTYTHRLVKILPGPTYSTKGDLDATPDAWVLTRKDIIGVATHHYKRVGWLVRALPWLALGSIVLMGLATFTPRLRRRVTYFVGGTIVLSIPILVLRPLVRGVFAGSGLIHGRVHAMVVNTGLLPLKFVMKGAPTQHTASGYPTTLIANKPSTGFLRITGTVDLSFWGWVILVLVCLAPLLIAIAVPPKYWDGEELVPIDGDVEQDADGPVLASV